MSALGPFRAPPPAGDAAHASSRGHGFGRRLPDSNRRRPWSICRRPSAADVALPEADRRLRESRLRQHALDSPSWGTSRKDALPLARDDSGVGRDLTRSTPVPVTGRQARSPKSCVHDSEAADAADAPATSSFPCFRFVERLPPASSSARRPSLQLFASLSRACCLGVLLHGRLDSQQQAFVDDGLDVVRLDLQRLLDLVQAFLGVFLLLGLVEAGVRGRPRPSSSWRWSSGPRGCSARARRAAGRPR